MATYQSMIFLAPAAIALLWQGGSFQNGGVFLSCARLIALGEFIVTGIAACTALFGWAYWHQGTRTPGEMISRFFAHGDARVYLSLTFGKFLNMPIGMVRNTFPVLRNFDGIRGLSAGPKPSLVFFLLVMLSSFAFLFAALKRLAKGWSSLAASVRGAVVAAAVGFAFTLIPLLVWDPQYDKLWLQPLACLTFLVVSSTMVPGLEGRGRLVLWKVLPALFLCGLALNLVWFGTEFQRCMATDGLGMADSFRIPRRQCCTASILWPNFARPSLQRRNSAGECTFFLCWTRPGQHGMPSWGRAAAYHTRSWIFTVSIQRFVRYFTANPNNTLCGKWMLPIQAQTPDECKPAICARLIAAEGER